MFIISYKITFRSERITNLDIESLFTCRKDGTAGAADIEQMLESMTRHGEGVVAINAILTAMNGYLIPMNSEMDKGKVIINICLPFHSATKALKTDLVQIAKNMVNETPLTSKWKPDPTIFRNYPVVEDNIIKDQVSLVNSNYRLLNKGK